MAEVKLMSLDGELELTAPKCERVPRLCRVKSIVNTSQSFKIAEQMETEAINRKWQCERFRKDSKEASLINFLISSKCYTEEQEEESVRSR
ncbi:hypothetical protein RUM43_007627 [Polyplax serrata]|uniref:Uncharacterized protein n=1 Tax=Polyplax serrata TaxID=468196 RepID=A0AAN8P281_POLSC